MLEHFRALLPRIIRQLLLRTLRDETSYTAVADAVEWLVRANGQQRVELAKALAALMRTVGPRDWTRLYSNFRSPWIKPQYVNTLRKLPADDAVEMLGVATLSTNGYTREAAVRGLGNLGHRRAVPYLLLRLGDWVPQVRLAAWDALDRLMRTGIASQLIEHHNLLEHLVDRQVLRAAESQAIHEYLLAPESRVALEAGLAHDRATTRRFCFNLLKSELRHEGFAQRASHDPDPIVRRWLARLVVGADLEVSESVFLDLLRDPASSVSTLIIRSLSADQAAKLAPHLHDLALADARPIRRSARWVLESQGLTGFAAEARERIACGSPLRPGWVATLGETGDAAIDFDTAYSLLVHPRARVRAAAVTAIVRLDGERAASTVTERLRDSSGLVRRAAVRALVRVPRHCWADRAQEIVTGPTGLGQVAALQLLSIGAGWEAMPTLLRSILSRNQELRERAWQALRSWERRNGTKGWLGPSEACIREVAVIWPKLDAAEAPPWVGHAWTRLKHDIERRLRP